MSWCKKLCVALPLAMLLLLISALAVAAESEQPPAIGTASFSTDYARISIAGTGVALHCFDAHTGIDYCHPTKVPFASIHRGTETIAATSVALEGERLTIHFGDAGDSAVLKVATFPHYLTLEVVSRQR